MSEKVFCKYCEEEIHTNDDLTDVYHKKCKRLHDEYILSLCEPQTRELLKRIKNTIQLYGLYERDSVVFIEKSNSSEKDRKELHIILIPSENSHEKLRKIGSITPINMQEKVLEWIQTQIKATIGELEYYYEEFLENISKQNLDLLLKLRVLIKVPETNYEESKITLQEKNTKIKTKGTTQELENIELFLSNQKTNKKILQLTSTRDFEKKIQEQDDMSSLIQRNPLVGLHEQDWVLIDKIDRKHFELLQQICYQFTLPEIIVEKNKITILENFIQLDENDPEEDEEAETREELPYNPNKLEIFLSRGDENKKILYVTFTSGIGDTIKKIESIAHLIQLDLFSRLQDYIFELPAIVLSLQERFNELEELFIVISKNEVGPNKDPSVQTNPDTVMLEKESGIKSSVLKLPKKAKRKRIGPLPNETDFSSKVFIGINVTEILENSEQFDGIANEGICTELNKMWKLSGECIFHLVQYEVVDYNNYTDFQTYTVHKIILGTKIFESNPYENQLTHLETKISLYDFIKVTQSVLIKMVGLYEKGFERKFFRKEEKNLAPKLIQFSGTHRIDEKTLLIQEKIPTDFNAFLYAGMELPDAQGELPMGLECLQDKNMQQFGDYIKNTETDSIRARELNNTWGFNQKIVERGEHYKKQLNENFGFHKSDFEEWHLSWTKKGGKKVCEDFERFFLGYVLAYGSRWDRYQEVELEKILEMKEQIDELKKEGKMPLKDFELNIIHHCYCKLYDTVQT